MTDIKEITVYIVTGHEYSESYEPVLGVCATFELAEELARTHRDMYDYIEVEKWSGPVDRPLVDDPDLQRL